MDADVPDSDASPPDAGTPIEVPDEIRNLVPNTWTQISRNLFSDVDPCPERDCGYSAVSGQGGVIHAFNGGVFASQEGTLGGLTLWGGGHNSYYGNEVYLFDLGTLLWSRLSEPTVGQTPGDETTFGLDLETCRFYDGHPIAKHTYDTVAYIPTTRQFVTPTVGDAPSAPPGNPDGGCGSPIGAAFNYASASWSDLPPIPETQGYVVTEFDQSRNALWVWRHTYGTGGLARYDVDTTSWTAYETDTAPPSHATGAIDPVHDLFVVARFFYTDNVGLMVKDLANPDEHHVLVTSTGGTALEEDAYEFNGFVGLEWVPSLGRFVAWVTGSSLYFLTPPEGDWRTEEWVWTTVHVDGTPPTPPSYPLGPAGKFQVAPDLGIAFVITNRSDPVYAVKLAFP